MARGVYSEEKDFAAAREALDEAMTKVPYATGLGEERAWLFFDQGQFEEAIAAFDKAIELDPYLIAKQFSKAETLVRLNRADEALEVFRKLQQQFPDDAEITEQLCWFYIRMGQFELAREQQMKLRQAHPYSVLGLNALGGYKSSRNETIRQPKQLFARQSSESVSRNRQYYLNLALALIRQVKSPANCRDLEIGKRERFRRSKEQLPRCVEPGFLPCEGLRLPWCSRLQAERLSRCRSPLSEVD